MKINFHPSWQFKIGIGKGTSFFKHKYVYIEIPLLTIQLVLDKK